MAENFTTYTEVDGGTDNVTISANQIDFTALARNEETYVYDDFEEAHFGDFEHLHSAEITADNNTGIVTVHMLANIIGDTVDVTASTGIIVRFFNATGSGEKRINLLGYDSGVVDINDSYFNYVINTRYWFTTSRIGTTIQCLIYDDAERTSLVDTLSGTSVTDTYQYYYPLAAWNSATAGPTMTGSIYATDLQEAEPSLAGLMLPKLISSDLITPNLITPRLLGDA